MSEAVVNESRKTFFLSILLAYKDFSISYNLERARSSGESWVLFLSFTGALILFLANLPYQVSISPSFINGNIALYLGLLVFVTVFFMPLFLYLLSAVVYIILNIFKSNGSFYDVRLAVFWSMNVSGPVLITNGLLKGFFFENEKILYVSFVLEAFVGWIFASMLTEAGHFSSKYPIFLTLVFFIISSQLMSLI